MYSGKTIAKNSIYNLLGYSAPLLLAIILIPPLIKSLGEERFGILNLAWMIIGYFSFFDFGIGKALTKITAEKIGSNQNDQIPVIFWTSLLSMLIVSVMVAICLIFFVPSITELFNISDAIKPEALDTFYILVIAIPIVSTTAGLRGVLEAYLQFGMINVIRILLGIFTFLGPVACLLFTNSLFWMVVILIIVRIFLWLWYLLLCTKINPQIKSQIKINFNVIRPVIKFSAWTSLVNVIGPIILYSDRFLIGVLISASAITYYAVSYETVSKLLLISSALVSVLFPIFSSSYISNPEESKKIFLRGIKFIFLILYPFIVIIVTFAYNGIELWLGKNYADNSSTILQFLGIGILFNSLSSIPNNFFQGTGSPKIPALINLIEFPFYTAVLWFAINYWGIVGASITYMVAAVTDAVIMYYVAKKNFKITFGSKFYLLVFFLMIIILFIPFFINSLQYKIIFALLVLSLFIILGWKHFLTEDERLFFKSKLRNVQQN